MKIGEVRQKYYSESYVNPLETENFLLKELVERQDKTNELLVDIHRDGQQAVNSNFYIFLVAILAIAVSFLLQRDNKHPSVKQEATAL